MLEKKKKKKKFGVICISTEQVSGHCILFAYNKRRENLKWCVEYTFNSEKMVIV